MSIVRLRKNEDRRIRAGHPWVYSNEIDTQSAPLKNFTAGQEVIVEAHDKTFLGMAYINPHSLISARIFSRIPGTTLSQSFFVEQIQKAAALRDRLFDKPYYRLVFSEADGIPGVVIDRFGADFVMQINTAGMERQLDSLVAALQSLYPEMSSLLLRNDSQIRLHEGLTEYIKPGFGEPKESLRLIENSIHFSAPLLKGQKTGWFYDHRMNRARLKNYVPGKTALDVFSYVGGWGVQAAAFGASKVDCIEVSEFACGYIKENANLNQVADKVNVICDDAFDAMKELLRANQQYDVIVLDPPAFIKRAKDKKEGVLAYQRLNEMAIKLLTPGGILFSCSCSMHLATDELMQILQRVAYRTQSNIQILERGHQGPDHPIHLAIPETDYLKAIIARKI